MVLINTSEIKNKHSKAVLAQVTEVKTGRDNVVRVATLKYFKANSCKIVNNKLVGRPTFITRGVETLSKLNPLALQPCQVTEYLHRGCKVDHADQTPVDKHKPDINEDNHHIEPCNAPNDHHSAPLLTSDLNPDENTTVWIREDDINDIASIDHGRALVHPEEDTVPANVSPQVRHQTDNLPDIETQPHAPQQAAPSDINQQNKNHPNKVSGEFTELRGNQEHKNDNKDDLDFVANKNTPVEGNQQAVPSDIDQQNKSPPNKVSGELTDLCGNTEHIDDTKDDPDFVANKDIPVENNQVRQSTRNRKARDFGGDYYLY